MVEEIIDNLKYNLVLQRVLIDAGKDLLKGAAKGGIVDASIGLAFNLVELRINRFPKSLMKYVIDK